MSQFGCFKHQLLGLVQRAAYSESCREACLDIESRAGWPKPNTLKP